MWYRLTKLRLRLAAWLVGDNGMVKNVTIGKDGAGVHVGSGETVYVTGVAIHGMDYAFIVERQAHMFVEGANTLYNCGTGLHADLGPEMEKWA